MSKKNSFLLVFSVWSLIILVSIGIVVVWGRDLFSAILNGTLFPFIKQHHASGLPGSIDHYLVKSLWIISTLYALGISAILLLLSPQTLFRKLTSWYPVVVSIIFCVYAGYVLSQVCSPEFAKQPITMDDNILHFALGQESCEFIKHWGTSWGYNFFANAGQFDRGIDNFVPMVLFLLLGWTGQAALIFNLSVLLSFFIPVLLAWFFARNMLAEKPARILFLLVTALLIIGFHEMRAFMRAGVTGFVISTYFALYLWSLIHRYVLEKRTGLIISATAWGTLAMWIHPLTVITFMLLVAPTLALSWKRFTGRDIIFICAGFAIVVAANLPWILPYHQNIAFMQHLEASFKQTWPGYFLYALRMERTFDFLLILFAVYVYRAIRSRHSEKIPVIASATLLAMVAFFGTQLGLGGTEPMRFILPLNVVLSFATVSIAEKELAGKNWIYWGAFFGLVLFLSRPPDPLRIGFGDARAEKILSSIKETVPLNGRLLVQESIEHAYFDCHFTTALHVLTGREILFNPGGHAAEPQFPRFIDNEIFGRCLSEISDSLLQAYCRLYAVTHVLVFSPAGRCYFRNNRLFKELFFTDPYSIFEYTAQESNRCQGCVADVRPSCGSLSVTNAQGPSVILKYHYHPMLKIEPASLILEPVKILDDPVPFIRVRNGTVRDFVIHQK